jgi:alanine dehydrogenase
VERERGKKKMVLLLTSQDVKSLFDVKEFVDAAEESYKLVGLGMAKMLPRIHLDSDQTPGFLKLQPCTSTSLKIGGVHVYTVGGLGADQGIEKVVLLFNEETGELAAIIEADLLSWMKTGAVAAVATKYLARENAEIVGMIGSGRQARGLLMALNSVKRIKRVKVYSPNRDHLLHYCNEMSKALDLDVVPVSHAKEAVVGSDIISTTTSSKSPVFDGHWIEEGTHINAIGSHYPGQREVDEATITRSKVVVDSRDRALKEEGELLIPLRQGVITEDHIYGELGDIVAGKREGRKTAREITLFTSGGIASEYILIGARIYEKALNEGVGQLLNIKMDDSVPKALYSKRAIKRTMD